MPAMIFEQRRLTQVPLGPTTPIFAPGRKDKVTSSRTTEIAMCFAGLCGVSKYSATCPG